MSAWIEVAAGVWRLRAVSAGEALEFNSYLVEVDAGRKILVDAGPAALGRDLVAAARDLGPIESIASIVLLDASPLAFTALPDWVAAGFRGEVVADWRVVAALALGGVVAKFRDLREADLRLAQDTPGELLVVRPAGSDGATLLCHKASGFVFSGRLGSSRGRNLPDFCADPEFAAQRLFLESFGYGMGISLPALPREASGALCPRFGSLVPAPLVGPLLGLSCAPPPVEACVDPSDELESLMDEIATLRSSNYELREAMVGASDAALRDSATGLYGKSYAEAFVQALIERKSDFAAAFVRIDRIKELNRALGASSVDVLLRDLASVLQELAPEGFLFRWTGPVILLVIQDAGDRAFAGAERIRGAIASEKRFAKPVTASIALARGTELEGGGVARLGSLARDRLKLLDRRGGDAVLDRSDFQLEERSLILALDSNPLFLDYLVEFLEREGFRTRGATRGGEALELMDYARPELVIADSSLPQFDAFQIRMRMRSSSDLHDIPFILLVDSKRDELIARAHSLSIYHILRKPVSMTELVGIARSLIARNDDGV